MSIHPDALRYALRGITQWLLVIIGAAEIAIGIIYGWTPIGVTTSVAAPVLAAGIAYSRYREILDAEARAADRKAHEARLDEQARAVREVLDGVPSLEALAEQARKSLRRRADLVALGLACPVGCAGCAEDEREHERHVQEMLAERAVRHGHARADVEL